MHSDGLISNLINGIIGLGVVGYIFYNVKKSSEDAANKAAEERRRRETPCEFIDGISKADFECIAKDAGKQIKRISEIHVEGPVVLGTVESQSGISEWHFTIDFNNYGHITGDYWLTSENTDSKIPTRVAENIKSAILRHH